MNILLTGHKGFIGNHLLNFLQSKNHTVLTIDKQVGFDIMTCDFPNNVELIIHLAGLSGVKDSLNKPTEYWKTNVIGSQRLFDFYKNKRIMFASSSTAYEPWTNPYAMSKYGMELIAPENSLAMRFTTVYGQGARENMLIPKIIRNKVEYLNVNHIRDFIHISDLISAIVFLMNTNLKGFVDIGSGKGHYLTDIAKYFKFDYEKVVADNTERLNNTANITQLNKLGWYPKIDLYNYIKENRYVN